MSDDSMKIHIEGKVYALDDFSLGEMEWLEDELGGLDDEHLRSMKAAVRFVTVIKRRENPEFSIDDARNLKVTVFDEPAPENGGKKRPTKGSKPAASTSTASGAAS